MGLTRDENCAVTVGKMNELGRFDREFLNYGCAYLKNEVVHYQVSSEEQRIQEFIEKSALSDIYPTKMMSSVNRCQVPAGLGDDIALNTKIELAKKLKVSYPKVFFDCLLEFAQSDHTNGSYQLLADFQNIIDGSFDEEKLQLFQGLVDLAFNSKVLNREAYDGFMYWLKDTRKQMLDDMMVKDILERHYFGFAYLNDQHEQKLFVHADQNVVYRKRIALEQMGYPVTPNFSKSYWFDYKVSPKQIKMDFIRKLRGIVACGYLDLTKQIKCMPNNIDKKHFKERFEYVQSHFDQNAVATFKGYGFRWNVNVET